MTDTLIVFAREPQLGQVKKRLAADLGDPDALAIYRRLLDRTLRTAHCFVRGANRQQPGSMRLVVSGHGVVSGGRLSAFCAYGSAALQSQQGQDLGQRMHHALRRARLEGANRAVLIGCDCPQLSLQDLRAAFANLDEAQLVIAPTRDGGYCLIGSSIDCPQVFEAMPWGTAKVAALTLDRASMCGWSIRQIREQFDIDHARDWRRWCRERAASSLPEHHWQTR